MDSTTTFSHQAPAPADRLLARGLHFARMLYVAGVVLMLLVIGPAAWIPSPIFKFSIFVACLAAAALLYTFAGGGGLVRSKGKWTLIAAAALPVVYLISYVFSTDRAPGFLGSGVEIDSILFVVTGFLALVGGFLFNRKERHARTLLYAISISILIGVAFQYADILAGVKFLPAALFSDPTINLIGKWNDLALLAALCAVVLAGRAGAPDASRRAQWLIGIILALLGLFLVIANFNIAWYVVLGGALLGALVLWLSSRATQMHSSRGYLFLGIVAAVAIVNVLWGGIFNAHLPSALSVPSLEVRPGFSTTLQIAQSAHSSLARTLIGTGPNTFIDAWLAHKPLGPSGVNLSQFWNLDFVTGYSVLSTAYASTGLLGVIAWLVPLALSLLGLLGLMRRQHTQETRAVAGLGIASILLWVMTILYAPSQDVTLLAFITTGAFLGVLYGGGESHTTGVSRLMMVLPRTLSVVFFALCLLGALVSARFALASSYEQRAAAALSQGDVASATAFNTRSENFQRLGSNLRLGVAIDVAKLQQILSTQASTSTADAMRAQFQAALADAINVQGQGAVLLEPMNYQSYVALGSVYDLLVPLKIQGAYENDVAAYQAAMTYDPTNPTLPLLLARAEATQDLKGNLADVQKLAAQSLQLKSNYTDALLFTEQLAVTLNDLPSATKAALAAVQSAPDQAPLWMQLGLYYYVGNDMTDAVTALEHAANLVPDYANAEYFLGLAYYAQGRTQDAIAQFENIAQTNPDNAEVKLILSNLQAGKSPFAGAKPPITTHPASRAQAPVKE